MVTWHSIHMVERRLKLRSRSVETLFVVYGVNVSVWTLYNNCISEIIHETLSFLYDFYVLCNHQILSLTEIFDKDIGSKAGAVPGCRENPLYSGLWIAQGLLRKGYMMTISLKVQNCQLYSNFILLVSVLLRIPRSASCCSLTTTILLVMLIRLLKRICAEQPFKGQG